MDEHLIEAELNIMLEKYIGLLNTPTIKKAIKKEFYKYIEDHNLERYYNIKFNITDYGDIEIKFEDKDEDN
jgi:hypothetical protein